MRVQLGSISQLRYSLEVSGLCTTSYSSADRGPEESTRLHDLSLYPQAYFALMQLNLYYRLDVEGDSNHRSAGGASHYSSDHYRHNIRERILLLRFMTKRPIISGQGNRCCSSMSSYRPWEGRQDAGPRQRSLAYAACPASR